MKIAILVVNNITFIYVVAKKDKTCTFFREITHINKTIFFREITDEFRFTSRRCDGYPFSLTIYVNRQCHVRLSTCCEAKR